MESSKPMEDIPTEKPKEQKPEKKKTEKNIYAGLFHSLDNAYK